MEAVRDIGLLLAADDKYGTEPLAPDDFDQVFHDAVVVDRRGGQAGSSAGVARAAGGWLGFAEPPDDLADSGPVEIERQVGFRRRVVVFRHLVTPFDVDR